MPPPAPAPPPAPTEDITRAPEPSSIVNEPRQPERLLTEGLPPPADRQALVIEMPGPLAVTMGLAVAEMGYRPVPLFNACPAPWVAGAPAPAAVDVDSIQAVLARGAGRLSSLPLPADAPPAFLLDADRQKARMSLMPGVFDNRSVVFPTDFPSAAFLQSQGIMGVVLLREMDHGVLWDLVRALRGWERAGLPLRAWRLDRPGAPEWTALPRFGFVFEWLRRLWAFLSLRRNPLGGYGALVEESAGG
jgi:hypothetical protein